jgi:tetratricopeptide (TPR) repeat protein
MRLLYLEKMKTPYLKRLSKTTWGVAVNRMASRLLSYRAAIVLSLAIAWVPGCLAQSAPQNSMELPVISPAHSYPQIDALVKGKKWKEVAAVAADLHRTDADNPTVLYWLGTAHLQLREPVEAVQAFRSAEKLNLDTALFHEGLGLAYYDLNQFRLFEEQMTRAATSDPRDSKPNYYMGLYRWSIRSDAAGALDFFEKAIQLAPNDWKSIYQSGNCLEQLGKVDEARGRYEKSIALLDQASSPYGWPYQGLARLTADADPQRALQLAKKAVELEPNEPSNHLQLALIYERIEKLPDAIQEAEIAADKNPNDSKTHYALYRFYREAGDPRAKTTLEKFEQTKRLYDPD